MLQAAEEDQLSIYRGLLVAYPEGRIGFGRSASEPPLRPPEDWHPDD